MHLIFMMLSIILLAVEALGIASAAGVASGATATCTPKTAGNGAVDDVPAIQQAISECFSGTIVIPQDTTYYINSQLSLGPCSGCTLQLDGTLIASPSVSVWEGANAMVTLKNLTGVKITSPSGHGTIDGNGQAAWDAVAANSSLQRVKAMISISNCTDVQVSGLRLLNPPNTFTGVGGSSSRISWHDMTLTAISTSQNPAINTDGFDINHTNGVTISDTTVVNEDDCVAVSVGSSNVHVSGLNCTGSHGLSIGSLGKSPGSTSIVQNVYFGNCTMINCTKAAGIKLWPGGPDHGMVQVSNVTWDNIAVDGSEYAFQIQSCYGESADYCSEYPSTAKLTEITVRGFRGTTSSRRQPVVANINCPGSGTCGLELAEFSVVSPNKSATILCANVPSDIGVACTEGASG